MAFWLKKFVSFWLMPLPFCLLLLAAGWWRGRKGLGRPLITVALLLLVLFSNKVVSNGLIQPLERRYPPIPEALDGRAPAPLAGCRYVVVLGSGHTNVAAWSAANKLSSAGLSRIAEGVRLLRLLPGARLIVSGPADNGQASHASVLAAAAESLGVAPERILRVEDAHDTEDESRSVKRLVGSDRIALVTSAWHLPRAADLFRQAGVDFVPCPADYAGRSNDDFRWGDVDWDVESLDRSTRAAHEYLGRLWLRIR